MRTVGDTTALTRLLSLRESLAAKAGVRTVGNTTALTRLLSLRGSLAAKAGVVATMIGGLDP